MGVKFPNIFSYYFKGPEASFKQYVRGVCEERGYTDDETWGVRYGYGSKIDAPLFFHVEKIFERYTWQLTSYGRTKTLAKVAANNICPPKLSGGGTGSSTPTTALPHGNGTPRRSFLLMFSESNEAVGKHVTGVQTLFPQDFQRTSTALYFQYNPPNPGVFLVNNYILPPAMIRPPVPIFLMANP
jgi:hypothetical protein